MNAMIIEGVRCFHDRQTVPLAPVTLLVGENSSGKTTFLALARAAWQLCHGPSHIDFNEDPFLMGAFDQIASYRGGRAGRVKGFTIGAESRFPLRSASKRSKRIPDVVRVTGSFADKEGQPILTEWKLDAEPFRLGLTYEEDREKLHIAVTTPSGAVSVSNVRFPQWPYPLPYPLSILSLMLRDLQRDDSLKTQGKMPSASDLEALAQVSYDLLESVGDRPYASAPIRTRPQRTYDPITDVPSPEGAHVPMILARTSSSAPEAWDRLRTSLRSFGAASGLFSNVEVRRMGQEGTGPFQIRIKISGPAFNLVDVGYGVSQVLPIVVDSLRAPAGSTFLIQQPEVHLHPRAQAELGSFLASLAKEDKKRFLIETHSDYLVDRIRADIRDGKGITADDVSILYFERENGSVTIHPLKLDRTGNIVNAPTSYGRFFLDEEKRLLGAK